MPSFANPRIDQALEDIYGLFAAPRPSVIIGCPCCIDSRRVDVLLAKPLRELTGAELWRYITGVFLTVGGTRDFRYLLPRILEIAVREPGAAPHIEIVIGKLRLAGWSDWPKREHAAIEALVEAWFQQALSNDLLEAETWLVGSEAESVLCGAARADIDIAAMLARLAEPSAQAVRDHLAAAYAKPLAAGSTPRSFWEDAPEGWRALAAILAPVA